MSDMTGLVAAFADLWTPQDTGSGAPVRISGHEADRLAAMPRPAARTPRTDRPLLPLRRRPSLRRAHA